MTRRVPASVRTRESLSDLIEGRLSSAAVVKRTKLTPTNRTKTISWRADRRGTDALLSNRCLSD